MDKIINSRIKATKEMRYKDNRDNIILQLNKLIGITLESNEFYMYELQNNKDLIKYLLELIPEIKIYYKYSTWGFFSEHNLNNKNPLSLLRALYNNSGYKVYISKRVNIYEGIKKQYRYYKFIKK